MAVVQILCALLFVSPIATYEDEDYQEYEIYDYYGDATASADDESNINRVKRFEQSSIKTLSLSEVQGVEDTLNQMLSGNAVPMANPFTPQPYLRNTIGTIARAAESSTEDKTSSQSENTETTTELFLRDAPGTELVMSAENQSDNPLSSVEAPKPRRLYPSTVVLWDTTIKNVTDFGGWFGNVFRTETTEEEEELSTTPSVLDVPALIRIISHLAEDFESNLTQKLNETLRNMSLPTCGTPTAATTVETTTSTYDANYTGAIVAKCFVCGLDVEGVPRHAQCADAFAGDFLPLVPVDPTARAHISKYRKYCTYSNIPGYQYNETRPRTMLGRWSGGCAVRWIDLSGIYTQRVCRNRLHPTMGKHYASKRMAKLERALWSTDDGCIISPMATLVPLSRGISLYARFHVCVCTGSWCNIAGINSPWTFGNCILLLIAARF